MRKAKVNMKVNKMAAKEMLKKNLKTKRRKMDKT